MARRARLTSCYIDLCSLTFIEYVYDGNLFSLSNKYQEIRSGLLTSELWRSSRWNIYVEVDVVGAEGGERRPPSRPGERPG